jgi:hypothetical protein
MQRVIPKKEVRRIRVDKPVIEGSLSLPRFQGEIKNKNDVMC